MIRVNQDLHIHTVYSVGDGAVVPQQTLELIKEFKHSRIIGISDHLEYIPDFEVYSKAVRQAGFYLGTEVKGGEWADRACETEVDYYVYHCLDTPEDYRGAEKMLVTGRPVIIAHPQFLETDLSKVPDGCLIEINNRYVWRNNWKGSYYTSQKHRLRFVISSDAHQPNWLNQQYARFAARELEIEETLLFAENIN